MRSSALCHVVPFELTRCAAWALHAQCLSFRLWAVLQASWHKLRSVARLWILRRGPSYCVIHSDTFPHFTTVTALSMSKCFTLDQVLTAYGHLWSGMIGMANQFVAAWLAFSNLEFHSAIGGAGARCTHAAVALLKEFKGRGVSPVHS